MRDSWLQSAALLDPRIGGAPADLFAETNLRRTLYAFVDREALTAALRTFDFANPDLSIPQRTETTVPQQALFLLNHPFTAKIARALNADPDKKDAALNSENRVRNLYTRLLQREPKPAELRAALAFVEAGESVLQHAALAQQRQPSADWQYGYGGWDEKAGRLKSFTPLPHRTGTSWQGGGQWPDPALGWVQLTATGGHPGNDLDHAAVRRWTAPHDGEYVLTSLLVHEAPQGDGVRAFVGSGGSVTSQLCTASVHVGRAELNAPKRAMKAGDTLDFVTDIGGTLSYDQFLWNVRIQAAEPAIITTNAAAVATTSTGQPPQEWRSDADFSTTTKQGDGQPLTPWEQLAQTLMLTNEFLFPD
jgi:hypothetical protein